MTGKEPVASAVTLASHTGLSRVVTAVATVRDSSSAMFCLTAYPAGGGDLGGVAVTGAMNMAVSVAPKS